MKITILMFSVLALAAGCSSEKTTSTPVAATVAQQDAAEAGPAAAVSPVAEMVPQLDPEPPLLPTSTAGKPWTPSPAQIAVPSPVKDVPAALPTRADGRIEAAELAALVASGEAILVDVRSAAEWRSGHAQGAIHIPYSDLFARSVELPHEALIALYCT